MNSHLSKGRIEEYLENKIPVNELLAVDDHLAECSTCAHAISSKAVEAGVGEEIIDLEAFPTHLSFEVLESLANESVDEVQEEIAHVHLKRCDACRQSLNELTVLRHELEEPHPNTKVAMKRMWQWMKLSFKPSYLIPALGLLLLGAFAVWFITSRKTPEVEQAGFPAANEALPPSNEITALPSDANANFDQNIDTIPRRTVVASVYDSGKKIELYDDGHVNGLSST